MPDQEIKRRGLMLVLSSPSGAGKTTISRKLLACEANVFGEMVNRGELLEHAKVFGHYYGTPKKPVEAALAAGGDVLFDIDWQGTQQLAQSARSDLVAVFILPPTTAELERRLKSRAQDSGEVVASRMAKAADEMSHWPEYDYIVVNVEVEESVAKVRAILLAERLRRERQTGLVDFVNELRQ